MNCHMARYRSFAMKNAGTGAPRLRSGTRVQNRYVKVPRTLRGRPYVPYA